MSLLEVRKNFVQYSGRFDLIVDRINFADKGANFYIRAGQQYLDTFVDIFESESKTYAPLAAGAWYQLIADVRVIEHVYLVSSIGDKTELNKISVEEFRNTYRSDPSTYISNSKGYCAEYCVTNLRTTPLTQGEVTIDEFGDNSYTVSVDDFLYTGILFSPPLGETGSIEIIGKFYQPKLMVDTDSNYWTEVYPQILVMSACRQLEISYRNTVGVKDWEAAIAAELHGLELDFADEISNQIRKFRG